MQCSFVKIDEKAALRRFDRKSRSGIVKTAEEKLALCSGSFDFIQFLGMCTLLGAVFHMVFNSFSSGSNRKE